MSLPEKTHKTLNQLDGLPSIPNIARKILTIKINTEQGERELLELIEKDPVILSKIIGLANSPIFGTGRSILTLHDALAMLGSRRIKMTALSVAMMTSMQRKNAGLLNIDSLWQHSLSVAMTMDTLARLMPKDLRPSEEIYLSGLLHDIGFMVLDYIDPKLSDQLHSRLAAEPARSLEEIESEMLTINHCDLGAELGKHWGLPESIIAVLRYHHAPDDERALAGQPLISMYDLAGRILPPFGPANQIRTTEISAKTLQNLGIDPIKVDEIIAQVQAHVQSVSAMNS